MQITPQIAGTVLSIHADDTEYVESGKPLVSLDKADAQITVAQAEAQLAKTVRSVRNLRATSTEGEANVTMRRSELRKAEQDLARRRSVESSGAVSGEELQHAVDAVNGARATLDAARKQLEAQRAMVDRTDVHDHPDVLAAAARVREAYLALSGQAALTDQYQSERNLFVVAFAEAVGSQMRATDTHKRQYELLNSYSSSE